jgi:hypothetical protein
MIIVQVVPLHLSHDVLSRLGAATGSALRVDASDDSPGRRPGPGIRGRVLPGRVVCNLNHRDRASDWQARYGLQVRQTSTPPSQAARASVTPAALLRHGRGDTLKRPGIDAEADCAANSGLRGPAGPRRLRYESVHSPDDNLNIMCKRLQVGLQTHWQHTASGTPLFKVQGSSTVQFHWHI